LDDAVTEQPPGGRADATARVAVVLLLLGVAVLGISGRRHLDWAAIAAAPGSTWIGLGLIAAAAFVVVLSVNALRRMVRTEVAGSDAPVPSIEGSRVTWYGYLAAVAVIAVAVLLVYLLLKSALPHPPPSIAPNRVNPFGRRPNSNGNDASAPDTWALVIAILTGVLLAVVVMVRRRRAELAEERPGDDEPTDETGLAEAVAAAEVELDAHGDDTRAAIIAAYLAMERQLAAGGVTRRASDTPTDFLLRAMATARVSRGSATRLTDLFREARFSTHPMGAAAREDAARALARVADDLVHGPRQGAASQQRPGHVRPRE
jgi:Domain of unknown function (DUF4129)